MEIYDSFQFESFDQLIFLDMNSRCIQFTITAEKKI